MYFIHSESLREVLYAHIREPHERLRRHPLLAGIMHPGYPGMHYWTTLLALYHYYGFIESAIQGAQHLAGGFDYAPRRKHPWLQQDLSAASIRPEEPSWQPAAAFAPLRIESVADLVGVLYVVEGATQGGQVIAGHIEVRLGITPLNGGRFFSGYGAQTDSRWQEFIDYASRTCPGAPQRKAAIHSALAVFAGIETVLDDYAARIGLTHRDAQCQEVVA